VLRSNTVLIRFWGTRGSIPTPGRGTTLYGGNTSCVEVRAEDGTVVILDCGTGARPLGLDLLARGAALPPMHILVTHTHWDHIQGFPFFLPAYLAGTRLSVYGARGLDRTLEGSLSGQMQHTYFPVQLDELRAEITFEEVAEERFRVGPYRVTSQLLNHTTATVAYRLETASASIAYVTDHEPFWWERGHPRQFHRFSHPGEERHVAFVAGADVLIHDAQYADTEYPSKRGWGHSTIEYAVDLAVRAGVKLLVLYHHDPTHSDAWIRTQLTRARRRAEAQKGQLEIVAAAEGDELQLSAGLAMSASDDNVLATPTGRVLVVGTDRSIIEEVREALAPDGYQVATADDSEMAVAGARARVDLVILVGPASESALLERTVTLRAEPWGEKVPVLILASTEGPGAAGRLVDTITDVLSRPFNPAMLRPRVRAWLARSGTLVERRTERHPRLIGASSTSVRGLLRGLPTSQRAALMGGTVTSRFLKDEVIFSEGDPAGGLYFIREGRVEMSMRLPDGRPYVLGIAGPGDTVGELAALDGGPRTATARVIEATVADYLPRDIVEPSLAAAPGAAYRLMQLMARRLRETDRYIGELTIPGGPVSD
jgi:phosphoribosyl 1,2-cyclic phosphodiesterase/CRP-like cAMP-binding protein